jgi:long-chain acyl-CoA synthetase
MRRVAAIAGDLGAAFGLDPGDRVALVMHNCAAFVESLFACWHGGYVAVPVNAKLHPREISFILAHSGARVCFATADLAQQIATLRQELPDLRAVVAVENADYAKFAAAEPAPIAARAPEDTAWLFYTSGTTGRPKGAMLSHRNLLAMTTSYFVDVDRIAEDDCIIHAAPMSHGSGMYILPHVAAAAKQVIPASGGFEPDEVFALIAAHPGAALFAAPTMVRRLVDSPAAASADTRNLKTIVYGGGPMYVEDCKRAMAVLGNKLAQIYGQGESPMTITALSKARHTCASSSASRRWARRRPSSRSPSPMPTTGCFFPASAARCDAVMSGYWRDPEATARTLRGGWLHTGDVGVFDVDGFLTLKDRSKDLIISGGSNIYPREVEEVLLRHPGVAEVAVVGETDRDWGETVVAFVVAAAGDPIEPSALDALCLDHLARFKRPKRYIFIDSLPKNNYGKVLKTELRAWLADKPRGR